MKKHISIIMVIAMVLCMIPGVAMAEGSNVARIGDTEYATLQAAIEATNKATATDVTIELIADTTFGAKLTIPNSKNVTITGAHSITRAATYTGTLFAIPSTAKLTLDGGLVIDGNNNWTFNETKYKDALQNRTSGTIWADYAASPEGAPALAAAMFVVDGSVNANNVTIQNSFTTKDDNGGDASIFKVNANASLTMTGANITHIATGGANSVVHLAKDATWTINDGTVISNTFAGRNGGVCRNDSGTIIMNGGTIEKNASINTNGTVFMMYKGAFEMNGGTICSNTGISGSSNGRCAAIYLHTQGKMTMTGGEICHNTGISYGGVDSNQSTSSSLVISGGYVGDNISVLKNTNKDINIPATNENVTITGGVFTQDVGKWVDQDSTNFVKDADGDYRVGKDVKDAKLSVKTIASPTDCGTITGSGEYKYDASATVTAKAADGYEFVKWMENGVVVCTDAEYTFTVNENRELVAEFEKVTPPPAEEPEDYEITSKSDEGVFSGQEKGLTFISNADFNEFVGVKVDGEYVKSENYTAESGSTKVTLNADYLNTLTEGEHELAIVSENGEAKTNFTVKKDDDKTEEPAPTAKPSSGTGIKVQYMGGNSFSTTNSDTPIAVEIDGVPVSFTGNGKYFTVGCIQPGADWVTVKWHGATVTTNFTPDVTVVCTQVGLPKTGDMPLWAAIAEFLGF